MRKNLIVFDIDDTLTHSAKIHQEAYLKAMIHFGFSQINTNWGDYKHHTDSYILKVNYEKNLERNFNESFIERFEFIMEEKFRLLKPISEIEGAGRMLKLIEDSNDFEVCFATGSLLVPALLKLKQAKLPFHQELLSTANDAFKREDIVENAINKAKSFYGVNEFNEVISVGDGIWDLQTAKNLGLHFLGIGEKHQAEFKKQGAFCVKDWAGFDVLEFEKKFLLETATMG